MESPPGLVIDYRLSRNRMVVAAKKRIRLVPRKASPSERKRLLSTNNPFRFPVRIMPFRGIKMRQVELRWVNAFIP